MLNQNKLYPNPLPQTKYTQEASPAPLCHYCDAPLSPGHVTDACGLSFCNVDCLEYFEESIPNEWFEEAGR